MNEDQPRINFETAFIVMFLMYLVYDFHNKYNI